MSFNNINTSVVECPFCGAKFDIHLSRCPYCDSVNEIGDEEQYFNKLQDIKENLEDLSDLQTDIYVEQNKTGLKKAIKIFIFMGVLVLLLICTVFIVSFTMNKRSQYWAKESLKWQKETYPKLDELYENKEFDELVAFENEMFDNKQYAHFQLWDWQHYEFLGAYRSYKYFMDFCKFHDEGGDDLSYEKYAFYDAMKVLADPWDTKLTVVHNLTKEDYAYIMEYQREVMIKLEHLYDLSTADIDELIREVTIDPPGVGTDYSKCEKVFKSIKGIEK